MKKTLLLILPLLFLAGCGQTQPTTTQTPATTTTKDTVVNCGNTDDPSCVFTNVISNFTNCQPVKVLITMDATTNAQATMIISKGENGACRFQFTGAGVDQDCLFAKENVKQDIIKGMLGMDNIPNDPIFQNIKATSCK
ncbi:MAG: hypothetical protein WC606_05315 [Candidatus Absconditabacterales bacterium]